MKVANGKETRSSEEEVDMKHSTYLTIVRMIPDIKEMI
jgi:hypothetical protein